MIQLAQSVDALTKAIPVQDGPPWLVLLLALLGFLTTSGMAAAASAWLRAKAAAIQAETERDAVIRGVENANGSAQKAKLEIKRAAADAGVSDSLHASVQRVTKRLEGKQ